MYQNYPLAFNTDWERYNGYELLQDIHIVILL